MKFIQIIKTGFIVLFLVSCANKRKEVKPIDKFQKEETFKEEEKVYLKEEIAKYAISSIMNQPLEIIEVKELLGIGFHVFYVRKSDKKRFDYKIRISGQNIIWGNLDGRWRDTKYDEKIKYLIEGDKLRIIQVFEDGSETVKVFSKI
jgi:hypothetical protein